MGKHEIDGRDIFRDCYRQSYENVLTKVVEGMPAPILVHGYPRLQREDLGYKVGQKYGHAWVEFGDKLCLDPSTESLILKPIYYAAGQIIESECVKFTVDEARFNASFYGHFGDWNETPPADAVWSN